MKLSEGGLISAGIILVIFLLATGLELTSGDWIVGMLAVFPMLIVLYFTGMLTGWYLAWRLACSFRTSWAGPSAAM